MRLRALLAMVIAVVAVSCGSLDQIESTTTPGVTTSTTASSAESRTIVFDYVPTRSTDLGLQGLVNRAADIVTLVTTQTELSTSVSRGDYTLVSARIEAVVRSTSQLSSGVEISIRQVGASTDKGVAILRVGVRYLAFLVPLKESEVLGGPGRYLLVREFGAFSEVDEGAYAADDARSIGGFTDLPARISLSEVQRLAS